VSGRLLFERVRRAVGGVDGAVSASARPALVEGRPEDFRLSSSRLIEDPRLEARPVGPPRCCPDAIAFLDGTQRYEVVSYLGTTPVVAAIIAAAVRLRRGGTFATICRAERRLLVGPAEVISAFAPAIPGFDQVETDRDGRIHPLKELELAHRAVDDSRRALELAVGDEFRTADPDSWLVIDGVLPDPDRWATDPRAIGISKSHATLPFSDEMLATYLTLPPGHRSSVFEPATGRATRVRSWGLRLWPFHGKDLLHGLVRIEVAAVNATTAEADRLSSWLLAERAPLARPDPRWDRLLYGIATVERHLRAR
jgi:hypothetical protein